MEGASRSFDQVDTYDGEASHINSESFLPDGKIEHWNEMQTLLNNGQILKQNEDDFLWTQFTEPMAELIIS